MCIIDILERDAQVGYQVLVQCVDVGAKFKVSTVDLIELPEKFKSLPPQAIEVYLCDIRPIDGDINWSLASKMFMAQKLSPNKEFYAKISLGAGKLFCLTTGQLVSCFESFGSPVLKNLFHFTKNGPFGSIRSRTSNI